MRALRGVAARPLLRLCAAACLLAPAVGTAQDSWHYSDAPRVVVFGDVHGAYAELTALLRAADVIDENLAWAGGATHVVSLGDLLDRGDDSRAVMDLLIRLQLEAETAGGRVHVVLGNHELMNLIGDLRYVSAGEYAAFAGEDSETAREAAYAALAAAGEGASPDRAAFDRMFPAGYFGHRAAFAPDGRYGSWLLSLPAAIVVNDSAYVHGGLPPLLAETSLAAFNAALHEKLRRYLELRAELAKRSVLPVADMQRDRELAGVAQETADATLKPLLEEFTSLADAPELGAAGPLWYRGSIYCKPLLEEPVLDAALAKLGAGRVVVGHTPTDDRRARAIYDGRLVMLDTGMLTGYYAGRPAALVIEGEQRFVQYANPPERAEVIASEPIVAHGMTDAELLDALLSGTVVESEQTVTGPPRRVEVHHGDATLQALFYPHDQGGDLELAAAALDGFLGTALVPPTVSRTLEGQAGALQLMFADAVSEAQRVESGLPLSAWCPVEPQLRLLYAFDVLTYNRGRNATNVFFHNELADLTITAHGRAFGTERTLPAGFDRSTLDMPERLAASMRALDAGRLEALLGEWLDSRQIRGLLARRDQLIGEP